MTLKKFTPLLFILLFFLVFHQSSEAKRHTNEYQAVIKIQSGTSCCNIVKRYGGVVVDSIDNADIYLVEFPGQQTLENALRNLLNNTEVDEAVENIEMELPEINQISQGFPDENRPVLLTGLEPVAYYEQPIVTEVGIDSSLLITTGMDILTDERIILAIIDNGIDFNHPLIAGSSIVDGHDFLNNDTDPSELPGPLYGHGTFVAGLSLLVAPNCSIMPLKAFNEYGIGDLFSVVKAINWAVTHNASVINMSFSTSTPVSMLQNAINTAAEAGILLVASVGNDSTEVALFPASYQNVIAVSTFDTNEVISDFSNYGSYVDISAPGVEVYSALAGEYDWGTWSGTSFSAPIVSAACVLARSVAGDMTGLELKQHLLLSSRTDLMWGSIIAPDIRYGYGALDIFNAVVSLTKGDFNNDGVIDISDLEIFVNYINATAVYDGIIEAKGDLNCDGVVDQTDVDMLSDHFFGQPQEFTPCY